MDKELLAILACPQCKGELEYTGDELICHACALAYPIRDDIPIMLIAEAQASPPQDEVTPRSET
ncbi:MAG: Trm112 family protein [Nitrospirae bacterium]|nr:Trm112 family protein [Nitrospirota bacterium]